MRMVITCFDSFGVIYILKDFKKFIENKNIKANIHRIQAINSILNDSRNNF